MRAPRTQSLKRLGYGAALLALVGCAAAPDPVDAILQVGVSGVKVMDSGVMRVSGDPRYARTEVFEYLRADDGGWALVNTISADDGRYRVAGRFDFTPTWESESAKGVGRYGDTPVAIDMVRAGGMAEIRVDGADISIRATAACSPDCFLNMSPSALAMFVMTRHYDRRLGGPQTFRWAGQDLDQIRTLSGGTATLSYAGTLRVQHAGNTLELDHYTFVESLPTPTGGRFELDFDLWTDAAQNPMGFRVRTPGGDPSGTVGFRQGYEEVRAQVLGRQQ